MQKGVLINFAKFTGKYLCQRPVTLLNKRLAQVFSYEFCEIYENTFLHRTPLVAASVMTTMGITKNKTLLHQCIQKE